MGTASNGIAGLFRKANSFVAGAAAGRAMNRSIPFGAREQKNHVGEAQKGFGMKRRSVDPCERLAPLAEYLTENGFAEMGLAMALLGTNDRWSVTRALHRRLDVTVVQTGSVPSRSDVVRTRWPPRGTTCMRVGLGGVLVQIVTNNDVGLRELGRLCSTAHETVLCDAWPCHWHVA